MTYNAGVAQNVRWGGGNYALTFNNNKVVSPTDQLARFDPQFNSSYLVQLHAAAAARIQDRSDAPADADGRHQPRQLPS